MSKRVLLVQWTADFEAPGPSEVGGEAGNSTVGGDGLASGDRYEYMRETKLLQQLEQEFN